MPDGLSGVVSWHTEALVPTLKFSKSIMLKEGKSGASMSPGVNLSHTASKATKGRAGCKNKLFMPSQKMILNTVVEPMIPDLIREFGTKKTIPQL